MNDIPPTETPYWRMVEDIARSVLGAYGYAEIRMPVVEKTELFVRSIGEVTGHRREGDVYLCRSQRR